MKNENRKQDAPLQEIVVTRLPIFDRRKDVFAYELLFQSDIDFQEKTRQGRIETNFDNGETVSPVIDSIFIAGFKKLTGGKRAFITFNRQMLQHQLPLIFPSELVGVEIQENIEPGENINEIVEAIKNAGYLVVINQGLYNSGDIELVRMADIIGVDFRSPGLQKRFSFFEEDYLKPRFLARGIENATDFEMAANIGYQYFQGDFFRKPDLIAVRNIPGYKINFLRILKEINKPDLQFDQIENILRRDISITYKLLRFVNSAAFGLKTTVQSIRQALSLIGEAEVRKWLSLIVLSGVGTDKPHELIVQTLIRAKFCESLAGVLGMKKEMPNYFLMGMLSMVDAFLDRPMAEILDDLPLKPDVKAALSGNSSHFRDVLELAIDYEDANWRNVSLAAGRMRLEVLEISNLYMEAIEWGMCL